MYRFLALPYSLLSLGVLSRYLTSLFDKYLFRISNRHKPAVLIKLIAFTKFVGLWI